MRKSNYIDLCEKSYFICASIWFAYISYTIIIYLSFSILYQEVDESSAIKLFKSLLINIYL